MTDPNLAVTRLLIDVVLPNLKTVQVSQSEQIAANDRLENAIEELRLHLESQFASLTAQLTACRAELAATQAMLTASQVRHGLAAPDRPTLIH
jgi:endonuclease YncB( thermonuclease family)